MIRIRFTPNPPLQTVARILKEGANEFRDFRPAWNRIRPQLSQSVAQTIRTEGAALGVAWPPPSPEYLKRKIREGHGSTPLVRTGALLGAAAGDKNYFSPTKLRMTYRARTNYAAPVQALRPFFAFTPQMEALIEDEIEAEAEKILAKMADAIEAARASGGGGKGRASVAQRMRDFSARTQKR